MAKFYGSLVGTPKQSVRPIPTSHQHENGTDHVLVRDTIELAAAANDTVQLAVLGWETVLAPTGTFWFDDLGTGCTISVGDVTYPNALCNAQDVATAAGSALLLKSVDIANYFKPLWQQLGYASLAAARLVGAKCELLFKVNTAAAAGTLTWQLHGQQR
ncbi:hypothetical protein [Caulobacter hibisci]|uniref:Uncharacterized protein n=1 Tax=Caulobacter hibisci TaxID=2035993 RepID=A0ABS0SY38_9CAUL|nr:hypothetical protein [Caulobacter hibisci]MBI1684459.1 hypothetical protein [Caulobacter hibisci]